MVDMSPCSRNDIEYTRDEWYGPSKLNVKRLIKQNKGSRQISIQRLTMIFFVLQLRITVFVTINCAKLYTAVDRYIKSRKSCRPLF